LNSSQALYGFFLAMAMMIPLLVAQSVKKAFKIEPFKLNG
jgi:hypothetical protein